MNRDIVRQTTTMIGVIATIVVNVLANALPINGQNTGDISDRFEIYFVPAGYVFSIWGLIYLGLIGFAIYQALPAQRENPRLRTIGGWFAVASVANIVWIFLWHYLKLNVTLLAMLAILASLIAIYLRLGIGKTRVSVAERWAVQIPFSVYLGWITVATIANATQLLDYLGWSGWGVSPELWTAIMLAAAVIIAALMTLSRWDAAYLLVLVWAFIGIALKHGGVPLVSVSAWTATVVVVLMVVASLVKPSKKRSLA
jgi:hypothetical protein